MRHSGFPVADYGSPDELGSRVLADFEHLIDRLHPPEQTPDAAVRAAAVHAAFGRARFGLSVHRAALETAVTAAGSGAGHRGAGRGSVRTGHQLGRRLGGRPARCDGRDPTL
ncbi:hypothetical protein GCM10009529_06660 [Micropruina glycogenica]